MSTAYSRVSNDCSEMKDIKGLQNKKLALEYLVNGSQISQKLGTIINSIKQQGLDSREFSIEMDIASDVSQFPQKISSVLDSMEQQGLKTKECELEISTQSTSDASQTMQKISSIVNTIKEQGFDIKEIELDTEKEE